MVENLPPQTPNQPEKPFALRAVVFTAAFLLFILGLVPSLFHVVGEVIFSDATFWGEARIFWRSFGALIGHSIFIIGLASYLFCSGWLIAVGRGPHVEFDPPKVFVATGPYRWVRNPVVITLLVTALGEAIALNSIGIFILVLVGMPLAHMQVTKIEEPNLRERFGQSYIDYCSRVNRWLPSRPRD